MLASAQTRVLSFNDSQRCCSRTVALNKGAALLCCYWIIAQRLSHREEARALYQSPSLADDASARSLTPRPRCGAFPPHPLHGDSDGRAGVVRVDCPGAARRSGGRLCFWMAPELDPGRAAGPCSSDSDVPLRSPAHPPWRLAAAAAAAADRLRNYSRPKRIIRV